MINVQKRYYEKAEMRTKKKITTKAVYTVVLNTIYHPHSTLRPKKKKK